MVIPDVRAPDVERPVAHAPTLPVAVEPDPAPPPRKLHGPPWLLAVGLALVGGLALGVGVAALSMTGRDTPAAPVTEVPALPSLPPSGAGAWPGGPLPPGGLPPDGAPPWPPPGPPGGFAPPGFAPGAAPGGLGLPPLVGPPGGGPPPAPGIVAGVDGDSLVVTTPWGSQQYRLGADTRIEKPVAAAPADLMPGQTVFVTAEPSADGATDARSVQILGGGAGGP